VVLRHLLERAVARRPSDCLLLSGGLDTSILAHVAAPRGTTDAVTVVVGPDAPDLPFAQGVARKLELRHHVVGVSLEDILAEVDLVVGTMMTFDPMEVRNSVVIARALREAHRLGFKTAMTGDAADEMFAGYSFLWSKSEAELGHFSKRMATTMRFSGGPLGAQFGMEVHAPFADAAVVEFALGLARSAKVGVHEGVTHGKWILREAFPEVENRWRPKDPIEVGAGTSRLPAYFEARLPPAELAAERERIAREDRVAIRDAEHLAYYRVFQRAFAGRPPLVRYGSDPCTQCGYQLHDLQSSFCVTCGAWPAR
jgi:asparagine synthase (glutamine-hydrolysing)